MPDRQPIVETLRNRLSIAALIGETVNLVGDGVETRGECTAHKDPGRGLFVNDAKGSYLCFSCGRGGDVVQWIRETDRCSEQDAVARLCNRIGMTPPHA